MPAAYEIVTSALDVQLLSQTETLEVQRVTARAQLSQIVYTIGFPPIIYNAASVRDILGYWAEQFDACSNHAHVAAVFTRQEVNAAQQLDDQAVIVVKSTSGRSTTEVVGDYGIVDDQHRDNVIGPVAANLDAVEAG